MAELDSFEEDQSIVLATSNKLSEVDKALRRGGRFDIDIRFDMPSSADRFLILKEHLGALQTIDNQFCEDLDSLAKAASGFVSSDLAQIVRNAQLIAIRDQQKKKVELLQEQ